MHGLPIAADQQISSAARCVTERRLRCCMSYDRAVRRWLVRVGSSVLVATLLVIGGVIVWHTFAESAPSMSLVPALPRGTAVVRNETESSNGAGGNETRVLELRSDAISTQQLADAMARAFDDDSRWRHGRDVLVRTWFLADEPCDANPSAQTSASVEVVQTGAHIEIGQYEDFTADQPGVIVRISKFDSVFCHVGSSIR
jgi:hypothetical protein